MGEGEDGAENSTERCNNHNKEPDNRLTIEVTAVPFICILPDERADAPAVAVYLIVLELFYCINTFRRPNLKISGLPQKISRIPVNISQPAPSGYLRDRFFVLF